MARESHSNLGQVVWELACEFPTHSARSAAALGAHRKSRCAVGKWINSSLVNYARCLHRAHRRGKCADKDRVANEGARWELLFIRLYLAGY